MNAADPRTTSRRRLRLGALVAIAIGIVVAVAVATEADASATTPTEPPSPSDAAVDAKAGPPADDPGALAAASLIDPMVEDASLPAPPNVQAFGDDRVITLTWDPVNDERVIGYYVAFRPVGGGEIRAVQAQARRGEYGEIAGAVQLQPVDNDVEYEIVVRAARGSYHRTSTGPLDLHAGDGARVNSFARADGTVSPATETTAVPSSARVDALRAEMTGFFDDFDRPAGPFDEERWNQAATACVAPGTAAAFVNSQFHAHNMLRSDCDRSGLVSRPRAVFDISGATPDQPAKIAVDVDGATAPRDTWYLDLIPLDANAHGLPIDLTSHNDFFDEDTEGPGNMLRINGRSAELSINYFNGDQQPQSLDLTAGETVCTTDRPTVVNMGYCDATQKVDGLSPLDEVDIVPLNIPNVRRHWLVVIDGAQLTLYIDSAPIAVVDLPDEFVAAQRYTVHSTVFSYNTGKSYVGPDLDQLPLIGPTDYGAMPYLQMLHWDNFGFTGPAPTEQVANYLEGGETGTQPYYSTGDGSGVLPGGNRTTIIPIPDAIGATVGGRAHLYFTIQPFEYSEYRPGPDDHVVVNGERYSLPELTAPRYLDRDPRADAITPYPVVIPIDAAHVVQGFNVVEFHLDSADENSPADTLNVHLELPYAVDTKPEYTPPIDVFGRRFLAVIEPAMTNCDQYNVIEQDLGLPYPDGRQNLTVGECELMRPLDHDN